MVKILTTAQKDAIVTIYQSKTKTQVEMAKFLGVSARTIGRVLDEKGVRPVKRDKLSPEAKKVMDLLAKHKVSYVDLEQILVMANAGRRGVPFGKAMMLMQAYRTKKSPVGHVGKQIMLPLARCAADRDGECGAPGCPQLRDGEPILTGRHCPLDNVEDVI